MISLYWIIHIDNIWYVQTEDTEQLSIVKYTFSMDLVNEIKNLERMMFQNYRPIKRTICDNSNLNNTNNNNKNNYNSGNMTT